jgi:hypothetical protein
MLRSVVLGIAIAAATAAAIPIAAYGWKWCPQWLNPYESRMARWVVYLGAGVALALAIALSRG